MKRWGVVAIMSCALLVAGIFFLSVLSNEALAETKTLKIGLISSVTGMLAPAFLTNLEGAKPTAEFINQRGASPSKARSTT